MLGTFHLGHHKAPGGQVQAGATVLVVVIENGTQKIVAALFQQSFVTDRAGGDDAHHLALHRALGQGRVANLLGNRHGFAQLYQPGQIVLRRMVGNPRHGNRLAGTLAALG